MQKIIKISTKGDTDIINITEKVQEVLKESEIKSGIVNVFVVGSTAGTSVIEYEPGVIKDLQEAFEKIAPRNKDYAHHEKWHDDNGNSHVRASLLKPDINIPFNNNKLLLGTWQQIILIDFDTSPRNREIVISVIKDN